MQELKQNAERNNREVQCDFKQFAGSTCVHLRNHHVPETSVAMAAAVFYLIS